MLSLAWIYLIIAGILEPCWAISLKKADRFRNIPWTVATAVFLIASLYLLLIVMTELPVGTAYAVWVGIGAVGTFILGILLMNDPADSLRILFMIMVIAGIVGLQKTSGDEAK